MHDNPSLWASTLIHNRRTTLRGWAGVEGKAFGDWDWAVTYGYGEFDGYPHQ